MTIVIIGTGNTATVLGKLFLKSGHTIIQIFGRQPEHAEQLAKRLKASFTNDPEQLNHTADIYLIAVLDNAVHEVASWLRVDKKLVLHTAASIQMNALDASSKNYGVLYPLQSLRKEIEDIPAIPFLIDGNTGDNRALVFDFAKTIGTDVLFANDHQRMMTHITAIMVSNFTNHLYVVAEDFCRKENLDFRVLMPLIQEVAGRLHNYSPKEVQTGPAVRNDFYTIGKHLKLLESCPFEQSLYRFLTESIQKWKLKQETA